MAKLGSTLRTVVHALVYGPPKSGKTELVGELAEHGFNLWWFDFENGSNTLIRSLSEAARNRVEIYSIPDTKDMPMGIETWLKVLKPGKYNICDTHGKVDCPICGRWVNVTEKKRAGSFSVFDNTVLGERDVVVFDSLTQVSNSAMSNIGLNKDDLWKPEWEHFRFQGNMLDRGLSNIQNAPYHVVCITHESQVELDESTGVRAKLIPIAGTQNFSRNCAKYFDEVVYCEVRNRQHNAASSTTYSQNVLTGSRSRTEIEKATLGPDKKPIPTKNSLLPIFLNLGIISQAAKAEGILTQVKQQIEGAK